MTDNTGSKLAFIVGHYKSGSTWLSHILALYPGIRSVREAHVFRYVKKHASLEDATEELFTKSAWGAGGLKGFPRHWAAGFTRVIRTRTGLATGTSTLPSDDVPTSMLNLGAINQYQLRNTLNRSENGDEYCRHFFTHLTNNLKPQHYLVEKTPTNIFHIEDINRIFPTAKLISIHRDGRDVVVSDQHHLSRTNRVTQTFEERVNKWKLAMNTEIAKVQLFGIHQISYEGLKSEPEKRTKALLDFLDLEYDDALIEKMISGASFEALSKGRAAGSEDTGNFFRKGIVGDWRNSFSQDEIKTFSEIAGELLVELGYENSPNWNKWS